MRLILLFIVLPALELWLLLEIGRHVGGLATFGLIVFTGILGANLARSQGMSVLQSINEEAAQGKLPARHLLEGVMVLVAGALLLTPGVLTDAFGFICLIPGLRAPMARWLWKRVQASTRKGHVFVHMGRPPGAGGAPHPGNSPFEPDPSPPSQPEAKDVVIDAEVIDRSES